MQFEKDSDAEIELEQRGGLLDGHMMRHRQTREEEVRIKNSLNASLKKLKRIAQAFLAFSMLIILNDCIGLSSQPFYLPHIQSRLQCGRIELTQECQKLKHLSSGLYISEMMGGFLLAFQGSSIYYFLDNYANKYNMPRLKILIKTLIGIYIAIVIVRLGLFIRIIAYCDNVDYDHSYKHFGIFLGNMVEERDLAIIITLLVIGAIGLCFYLSYFSLKNLEEVNDLYRQSKQSGSKKSGGALYYSYGFQISIDQSSIINKSHNKMSSDVTSPIKNCTLKQADEESQLHH